MKAAVNHVDYEKQPSTARDQLIYASGADAAISYMMGHLFFESGAVIYGPSKKKTKFIFTPIPQGKTEALIPAY